MRALFLFVCAGCGACLAALPVGSLIGLPIRPTAPLWFIGVTAPLRVASSSSG